MDKKAVDVRWDAESTGRVTAKTSIDLTMGIVGNRRKNRKDLTLTSMENPWFVAGSKKCGS